MNNFFILNLSSKILMKKHIFDTLCCSNSKKEAVQHILVKLFVRHMSKALFLIYTLFSVYWSIGLSFLIIFTTVFPKKTLILMKTSRNSLMSGLKRNEFLLPVNSFVMWKTKTWTMENTLNKMLFMFSLIQLYNCIIFNTKNDRNFFIPNRKT